MELFKIEFTDQKGRALFDELKSFPDLINAEKYAAETARQMYGDALYYVTYYFKR